MAIAPLPSSFSLPSANLRSHPSSWRSQELHLYRSAAIPHLARRSLCCSARKSRRGGASKSNKDLRDELRQFIAVTELPERRPPSVRELCVNGRYMHRNYSKRIWSKLHILKLQREMELSQLKQQIEYEKLAMSNLESRTAAELDDIQKVITEKDAVLCAAEEHLHGLKYVHIDYWANAQIVEVAGSFNGWQHKISMDLHSSSEHVDPPTSRKQQGRLWSTVLWLYPGVYEIKFIVDGQWKIDTRRGIITSDGITNNVLVVGG